MLKITEYQPYIELTGFITDCNNKLSDLNLKISELVEKENSNQVGSGEYSTLDDLIESAENTDKELLNKLMSQRAIIQREIPILNEKLRRVFGDFAGIITPEFQSKYNEVEKKIAIGFIAVHAALLDKIDFEAELARAGGSMAAIKKHFSINTQQLLPSEHSAHDTNFYSDVIANKVIKKSDLSKSLQNKFCK